MTKSFFGIIKLLTNKDIAIFINKYKTLDDGYFEGEYVHIIWSDEKVKMLIKNNIKIDYNKCPVYVLERMFKEKYKMDYEEIKKTISNMLELK